MAATPHHCQFSALNFKTVPILENFEHKSISEKKKKVHGYNTPGTNISFKFFLCVYL